MTPRAGMIYHASFDKYLKFEFTDDIYPVVIMDEVDWPCCRKLLAFFQGKTKKVAYSRVCGLLRAFSFIGVSGTFTQQNIAAFYYMPGPDPLYIDLS